MQCEFHKAQVFQESHKNLTKSHSCLDIGKSTRQIFVAVLGASYASMFLPIFDQLSTLELAFLQHTVYSVNDVPGKDPLERPRGSFQLLRGLSR